MSWQEIAHIFNGNITLECSNDGGYVFGPPLLRTLGAVGRRMAPVRWNFLGAAIDRVGIDAMPVTLAAFYVLLLAGLAFTGGKLVRSKANG